MALDLLELFTRLGRVGKVLRSIAQFRAIGLTTDVESLVSEFSTLRDAVAPITQRVPTSKAQAGDLVGTLVATAQQTVLTAVRNDQSARSWTVEEAAAEFARQLAEQSATVPTCATSLTPTALTPFAGDGILVTTLKGADTEFVAGVLLENIFEEILWLTCSQDAQTGGANRGREVFRLRGGVAQPDVWMDDWPAGSGGDTSLSAADPGSDADEGGNLLTNSGFDAFSSSAPDNWVIQVGSAGSTIDDTAVEQYTGAAALALAGNATLATIYQVFNSASGTDGIVLPLTRYAVAVRVKASAVPATGTLVLELVNASSAVVNDPQGNPCRTTIDLTAITTSYVAHSDVWVTPRSLPTELRFRLRVGTAIEAAKTVYVDSLCLVPMVEAYPGGPAVAVISGATPFVLGDGWQLEATNDRAGADFGSTWQALYDRLFGARELGIQLASDDITPTYGDEFITD